MNYLLSGEETFRIRFSPVDKNDFDKWLPFFRDPGTSVHWIEPHETPEMVREKWFDRQFYRFANNLGGMNSLVDKSSNELIGYCGLLVQVVDGVQELEVGYSLLPKYWNKIFVTEAAIKCRDFAFENSLSKSLIFNNQHFQCAI